MNKKKLKREQGRPRKLIPFLFGVPRSGGTVIYNIVDYLYDGNVEPQSHNWHPSYKLMYQGVTSAFGHPPAIAIYRDFRDACTSQWRVFYAPHRGCSFDEEEGLQQMTRQEVERVAIEQKTTVNYLDMYKEEQNMGHKILFLKYEDFFDNDKRDLRFDYIFKELENFLDIKIEDYEKEYIRKEFCFKSQKEFTKKYLETNEGWVQAGAGEEHVPFANYHEKRGIHGHHLFKGKIGGWKDLVRPEDQDLITHILYNELKRWGYLE